MPTLNYTHTASLQFVQIVEDTIMKLKTLASVALVFSGMLAGSTMASTSSALSSSLAVNATAHVAPVAVVAEHRHHGMRHHGGDRRGGNWGHRRHYDGDRGLGAVALPFLFMGSVLNEAARQERFRYYGHYRTIYEDCYG